MVGKCGIEPPTLSCKEPRIFESVKPFHVMPICLVVPTGFEPVTFTMSMWYSTAEIRNYIGGDPGIWTPTPSLWMEWSSCCIVSLPGSLSTCATITLSHRYAGTLWRIRTDTELLLREPPATNWAKRALFGGRLRNRTPTLSDRSAFETVLVPD